MSPEKGLPNPVTVVGEINWTSNLTVIMCGECGMAFAVPELWRKERVENHKTFYCPNGCLRCYKAKAAIDEVRDQVNFVQAQLNEAQHLAIVKGRELDKLQKAHHKLEHRISNGSCPCCNRTFSNLQKHMKSKHPAQVIGGANIKKIEDGNAGADIPDPTLQ
jgi:NMD protein affecting ribosome stability and mRNA decay